MPRSKSKPRYPLYSSLVFCCSQAPMSSHNPIDLLPSATVSLTTQILHDISTGGGETAPFHFLAPCTLVTGSHPFKGLITLHHFPFISYPFSITCSCFNFPDPHHHCLVDPRSHDLPISDYYSSIFSLVQKQHHSCTIPQFWYQLRSYPFSPSESTIDHQLEGLKKLKDKDYLQVQHTSWSQVLLSGQNHGKLLVPLEALAMS